MLLPHLASSPDDHRAWCLLAQAYLGLNDGRAALRAAVTAVRASPDEWALRLLSNALQSLRRYDEARDAADRAIELDPTGWRCHVQRANVDLAAENVGSLAWQAARRAVELAPQESASHQVLGRVALADGQARLAEREFREALRIDPDDAMSHNNLAVALMRRQRFGRATSVFLGAARLAPTNPMFDANLRLVLRVRLGVLTVIGFVSCVVCSGLGSATSAKTTVDYQALSPSDLPSDFLTVLPSGLVTPPPSAVGSPFLPLQPVVHFTPGHPGMTGHFGVLTGLAGLNVALAVWLFWRLRRAVGHRLLRLLSSSMRRDTRLAMLLTLPLLATISFGASAVIGYPAGHPWTIVALVGYLAGGLLGSSRIARMIWRRRDAARQA